MFLLEKSSTKGTKRPFLFICTLMNGWPYEYLLVSGLEASENHPARLYMRSGEIPRSRSGRLWPLHRTVDCG
jgi:hypothetical protein